MNGSTRNSLIVSTILACLSGCAEPEEDTPAEAPEREALHGQISEETGAMHEHASLAKAPDGRMAAIWTARETDFWHVMISFSEDDGATWSAPDNLLPNDRENLWASDLASIVAGPDGSFYVAFHAVGSIQVARIDAGTSVVSEAIVVSESSIISKPQIIVDEAGQLHVLYRNSHTSEVAYATGTWPSLNGHFPPVAEADTASFCADEMGHRLYLVYRDWLGAVRAITKPAPTSPWQATAPIEIVQNGASGARPTCAARGDDMWTSYLDDAEQIWVARSTLDQPLPAANWLLNLPGGTPRMHPRIALDDEGTIHVVHLERHEDGTGSLHRSTMVDGALGETNVLRDGITLLNMESGWLEPSVVGGDAISGVYVAPQAGEVDGAAMASHVRFFSEPQ